MILKAGQILSDVINIGKKFIPDKQQQLEFELKMRELDIADYANKKGPMENAISCVFPFIGFVFALYVLSNLIGCWYGFITGKPAVVFPIDEGLYNIIMVYLCGFFGKRTVDSYKGDKNDKGIK